MRFLFMMMLAVERFSCSWHSTLERQKENMTIAVQCYIACMRVYIMVCLIYVFQHSIHVTPLSSFFMPVFNIRFIHIIHMYGIIYAA